MPALEEQAGEVLVFEENPEHAQGLYLSKSHHLWWWLRLGFALRGFFRLWLLQHRKPLWGAAHKPPALQVVVDSIWGALYNVPGSVE